MAKSRRSVSDRDRKILWSRAGGLCAFPDCRQELVMTAGGADGIQVIGMEAHIYASSDQGPRGNPGMPATERDSYRNLVLLCPTHHAVVDKSPDSHNAETLMQWKTDHEEWVRSELAAAMPSVTFAELSVITEAMANNPGQVSEDFRITKPSEKMARNGLTSLVEGELTMGLSRSSVVDQFIQDFSVTDPKFGERLTQRFVAEYESLHAEGVRGDDLFESLRQFAADTVPRRNFKLQAAGLAVLSHLSEKCEIFEK